MYNLLRFSGARVAPSLAVGSLAALGVVMLGNLSGVLELAYVRGVGGDWFWQWVGIKVWNRRLARLVKRSGVGCRTVSGGGGAAPG